MKSFIVLGALVASTLAQTAQFTNTSFAGPFTIGQNIPLMWTNGNGLPVALSIVNSTWKHTFFTGRAVLPSSFMWTVTWFPGFVSGSYQLALEQVNGGITNSPSFNVVVPENTTSTNPTATTTVTYVYWDHVCGCTKTGTAMTPLNTGAPATTTSWWDHHCGCTKSAIIPVATMPAGNNYTAPAAPPAVTTPDSTPLNTPISPSTAGSSAPTTFRGEAGRLEGSVFGMIAMFAAVVVA